MLRDSLDVLSVSILNDPGYFQDYLPRYLLDAESERYWAGSNEGSYGFEFGSTSPARLYALKWRDRGDATRVGQIALDVYNNGAWHPVTSWSCEQSSQWQTRMLDTPVLGSRWKVVFTECPGPGQNGLCIVRAVQFLGKSQPDTYDYMRYMFSQMMNDHSRYDITLLCGGQQIQSHALILAASSPILAKRLKETEAREARVLRIPECEPQVLRDALHYIYTGSVSQEIHFDFAVLAHALDILNLVELAGPIALKNINAENVLMELRLLREHATNVVFEPWLTRLEAMIRERPELFHAVTRHC